MPTGVLSTFCGSPSGNARSVLFPPLLHPALRAEVHLTKLPTALAMTLCPSLLLHYVRVHPSAVLTCLLQHLPSTQALPES